jgi:hypothetical protein
MITTCTEEQVNDVVRQCENNIRNGTEDTFRSYEEGVKDAIEWLFFGSDKPIITDED